MNKFKYLLLPLFLFLLISCNVSGNNGSNDNESKVSVVESVSQKVELVDAWAIGTRYSMNGEKYYYGWKIDYDNGSLVIEDIDNGGVFLTIEYGKYNILYHSATRTYQGYLYYYGEFYILEVGN